MQAPFRNNLTGSKVDAAITACSDLTELTEGSLLGLFENAGDYDFTAILTQYADQVVTPTYKDLKEKAWALYNAMVALQADNRNQSKVDAACTAWRTMRVPWEQSEAVLFGPAGEETGLGLDPSIDSWPLDQERDIATIITNKKPVERRRLASERSAAGVGPRLPYHRAAAVQGRAEPKGARRMNKPGKKNRLIYHIRFMSASLKRKQSVCVTALICVVALSACTDGDYYEILDEYGNVADSRTLSAGKSRPSSSRAYRPTTRRPIG